VLAALKKAEDSSAWIVQWYDAKGEEGIADVTLPFTPRRAMITNFLEEDGDPVPFEKNTLHVPTHAHAIVTIKVER